MDLTFGFIDRVNAIPGVHVEEFLAPSLDYRGVLAVNVSDDVGWVISTTKRIGDFVRSWVGSGSRWVFHFVGSTGTGLPMRGPDDEIINFLTACAHAKTARVSGPDSGGQHENDPPPSRDSREFEDEDTPDARDDFAVRAADAIAGQLDLIDKLSARVDALEQRAAISDDAGGPTPEPDANDDVPSFLRVASLTLPLICTSTGSRYQNGRFEVAVQRASHGAWRGEMNLLGLPTIFTSYHKSPADVATELDVILNTVRNTLTAIID